MAATAQVYTDLRIWDGAAEGYCAEADSIRIEAGVITAVGARDVLCDGADVKSLGGITAIPGLIDAHVHMVLDPELRDPLSQLRGGGDEQLTTMAGRALAMVRAGITTARDLGGGDWLELQLRDGIAQGRFTGPRLLCAGQPITSPAGHCFFWGGEAASLAEAAAVIARQHDHGVDLIKVMATGGAMTKGSTPRDAQFDEATLIAIVADARQRGYPVAAHCHGTAGIRCAVHAGVNTIEHCSWVGDAGWGANYDAELAAELAARGIWVSPTVNAGWRRHVDSGSDHEKRVMGNFAAMKAAGVRLVASTDAGIPNVKHEDLGRALPVFAHFAALTPREVLTSATSDAADAIGLGGIAGRLAAGHSADILFVDGDPLADLACLAQPAAVLARGQMVPGTGCP
jgi:imidazolonepropionase-like amidohydrolase